MNDDNGSGGKTETSETDNLISVETVRSVELKIATVIDAERIEGTDKLLKLKVSLGDEKRQIVAGVAADYEPEDIKGKRIVVVTNLKPATIRGEKSEGMLLAADTGMFSAGQVFMGMAETDDGEPLWDVVVAQGVAGLLAPVADYEEVE